jgi:hypothetical protein
LLSFSYPFSFISKCCIIRQNDVAKIRRIIEPDKFLGKKDAFSKKKCNFAPKIETNNKNSTEL